MNTWQIFAAGVIVLCIVLVVVNGIMSLHYSNRQRKAHEQKIQDLNDQNRSAFRHYERERSRADRLLRDLAHARNKLTICEQTLRDQGSVDIEWDHE